MTLRQRLLWLAYPIYNFFSRRTDGRGSVIRNANNKLPLQSFYDLSITLTNGSRVYLSKFKGRKVLLVNTASDCIYTAQYAELERLNEKHGNEIAVIAFPSNDFNRQEQGTDNEIQDFCRTNYHVSFTVAAKSPVTGNERNEVHDWLTDPAKNGWNSRPPDWNFAKYLVDERGVLMLYMGPAVPPFALFKHIPGRSAH